MQKLKSELRHYFRDQRRALTTGQKADYAEQATQHLINLPEFKSAKHVALYMATSEEMQTSSLFPLLFASDKTCSVPVLSRKDTLIFVTVNEKTSWKANRYNILEPANAAQANTIKTADSKKNPDQIIAVENLDIVIVPLVSFDNTGSRLGMGAGYYDKAFAFKQQTQKPLLIGLAYECQRHENLPIADHDVKLDMVITEKACYRFKI